MLWSWLTAQEASKLTDIGNSISQNGTWLFLCHNGAILPATTMHLSENQRAIAYGQLEAGLSPQDVARHFGVHVKTIWRMWTRYMQQQNFKDRPRSGRPTVTTQWEDRYLGMTMAWCQILKGDFPLHHFGSHSFTWLHCYWNVIEEYVSSLKLLISFQFQSCKGDCTVFEDAKVVGSHWPQFVDVYTAVVCMAGGHAKSSSWLPPLKQPGASG